MQRHGNFASAIRAILPIVLLFVVLFAASPAFSKPAVIETAIVAMTENDRAGPVQQDIVTVDLAIQSLICDRLMRVIAVTQHVQKDPGDHPANSDQLLRRSWRPGKHNQPNQEPDIVRRQ